MHISFSNNKKIAALGIVSLTFCYALLQLSYVASSYDSYFPFLPIASYVLLYFVTLLGFALAKRFNSEAIYRNALKRFYISIFVIAGCIFLMALGLRELSFVAFTCLLVALFVWTLTGNFVNECRLIIVIFILFSLSPFDVRVSSPHLSTYKRESFVGWLDVHYGLRNFVDNRNESEVERGYSMGCVVPIYPLSKVYYIDFWPSVDTYFNKFK